MVGALGHHHRLGLMVGVGDGAGLMVGVGDGAGPVAAVEDGAAGGRHWAGRHSRSCSQCDEGGHNSGGPCPRGQGGEAAGRLGHRRAAGTPRRPGQGC